MVNITMFAEALREFHIAVDDLEANLQFLRSSSRLRPRLANILRWESMDQDAKVLVEDYIAQRSLELNFLYRGMVIVLAGAFEQLVRRLVHDAVVSINSSTRNYDALAAVIKTQNILRTGQALGTITEPPDHLALDYDVLCKNIGTCVPGQEAFTLNAEAFCVFISSVGPRHLVEVFRRVGIDLRWDDLGRDQNLKRAFDKRDTRETAKAVKGYLQRFISIRNKIAHTGSGGITVTDTDIEHFLKVFRPLCLRLAQVVQEKLSQNNYLR